MWSVTQSQIDRMLTVMTFSDPAGLVFLLACLINKQKTVIEERLLIIFDPVLLREQSSARTILIQARQVTRRKRVKLQHTFSKGVYNK